MSCGSSSIALDLHDALGRGTLSPRLVQSLRWQRLPEMEKLGDTLANHLDGIAAYGDHPVRFGVVEPLNTTIEAVLRRARGMRNDAMLLLKPKWATAHPIRSARDLACFLSLQGLKSVKNPIESPARRVFSGVPSKPSIFCPSLHYGMVG